MSTALTFECQVHFQRRGRGASKELHSGAAPAPAVEQGRVPRIARLMALAIRMDQMLRDGVVASYAELAMLGHVTRPRISQIMNLINLAPDIQEAILDLPLVEHGRDPIHLRQLQPIANCVEWKKQRRLWHELVAAE